jgi:hypothetical protein
MRLHFNAAMAAEREVVFTQRNLLSLVRAEPFVPFRLIRSDGGSVPVKSRESVAVGQRFAAVAILEEAERPRDRWEIVWYMHVTGVEMLGTGPMPMQPPDGSAGSPSPSPTPT